MIDEELAEIKARCDAASPGPWVDEITDAGDLIITVNGAGCMPFIYLGDMEETEADDHANAAFISHARTDVPALLAEVERLRADRDHARQWANYSWGGVDGLVSRGDAWVAAMRYVGDMREIRNGGTNVSAQDGWRVGQPVGER